MRREGIANGTGASAMTDAQIQFASDHSLLLVLSREVSRELQGRVAQLCRIIRSDAGSAVLNFHPAYGSVLITFDPARIQPGEMEARARAWLTRLDSAEPGPVRRIEIPVCYGSIFGPDLEDVAAYTGLNRDEVVSIHSGMEYFIYFVGFSPGFPYLGELPPSLCVPRLPTPRTCVPAGSVAIGGNQTGIYPLESPGGWRIIGRTPLRLFDPVKTPSALLRMGDFVRFRPVPEQEFARLAEVT